MPAEQPLPGDRATFYVPRSDDNPRRGRRLMYMRDLACCANGMAFYSTPSDLVRFALATNAGSVNGELAGGMVMSLMTRRDSGIVIAVASNMAHANTSCARRCESGTRSRNRRDDPRRAPGGPVTVLHRRARFLPWDLSATTPAERIWLRANRLSVFSYRAHHSDCTIVPLCKVCALHCPMMATIARKSRQEFCACSQCPGCRPADS